MSKNYDIKVPAGINLDGKSVQLTVEDDLKQYKRQIIRMQKFLKKELAGGLSKDDLIASLPTLMAYASTINTANGYARKEIVTRVINLHVNEHAGRLQPTELAIVMAFVQKLMSAVIDAIHVAQNLGFNRSNAQKCIGVCGSLA